MSEQPSANVELRTYTSLWLMEKRMYKFYDWTLPFPVSLRMVGIFLAVTVPWFALLALLRVPFTTGGGLHLLWLAPPAVLTWLANKPLVENKRLKDLAVSQATYLLQPRRWARMRPVKEPGFVNLRAAAHLTDGTSAPQPRSRPGSALRRRKAVTS